MKTFWLYEAEETEKQVDVKTDLHCPFCASKTVWREPYSEQDYGGGDRHYCTNCGGEFYGHFDWKEKELTGIPS